MKRPNFGKAIHGRFTRLGWVMFFILVLLLLSAWNTGENLLYIVFGCLFGMFFLSVFAGRWSLRKISFIRETPYAVFRGEPFQYTVILTNHKKILSSISLRIEQDHKSLAYTLRIPPNMQAAVGIEDIGKKRGIYRMPPCNLVTTYPFGFMELRRSYTDTSEVLVYPRIQSARLPALETIYGTPLVQSRVVGEGDEFFALRDYIYGDDFRLIVWRISARLGKWVVREMGVGAARIVRFVLDTRRTTLPDYEDQFEEMIDLAGSLMITLLKRQYSVGLFCPNISVECAKGSPQERRILDVLAQIEPVEPNAYPGFVDQARRLCSEPIRVIGMSPDYHLWGRADDSSGIHVLNPEAVIYA